VERLEAQGLLARDGERLRATPSGMLLLNAILAEIVRV
jgi:coproporphyrinogen III oxidase-like Fe-S oxidoreductase